MFFDEVSLTHSLIFKHNGIPPRLKLLRQILTIASNNPSKVAEIEAMLLPLSVHAERQPSELSVEETGSSYSENAQLKAAAAALASGSWALGDDSGLEVDALSGAPGLFSARYADGNEAKLKRLLEQLGSTPYRSACFRSTMALSNPEGFCVATAEGVCWGELLLAPPYQGGGRREEERKIRRGH